MKVIRNIVFSDEDRAIFKEALLAGHVGEGPEPRDQKPLSSLTTEHGPVSRERIQRAIDFLAEVKRAVNREADPAYWRRHVSIEREQQMAEVIMEARHKMQGDVAMALSVLADAAILADPVPTSERYECV